jgi:hypothetical protein
VRHFHFPFSRILAGDDLSFRHSISQRVECVLIRDAPQQHALLRVLPPADVAGIERELVNQSAKRFRPRLKLDRICRGIDVRRERRQRRSRRFLLRITICHNTYHIDRLPEPQQQSVNVGMVNCVCCMAATEAQKSH